MNLSNGRQTAFKAIWAVINEQQSLTTLIPEYKNQTRSADQALFQALVYGVLREFRSLYALHAPMLKKPFPPDHEVSILLSLGAFQLLRLDLGDHGVINETVKLADKIAPYQKNLVNAILRRIQRERSASLDFLNQSAKLNLPTWLRNLYPQKQEQMAENQILPPVFTVRLNPKLNPDVWAKSVDGELLPIKQAVKLPQVKQLAEWTDFQDGLISVQDASAQVAGLLLAPENQERILDACSAPGGKTTHLLELAPNAEVWALDHDEIRLKRVKDNLGRLKQKALLKVADAREISDWWDKIPFDAILLDPPCSGSGVIRRHPDIPFLRTKTDLLQFPEVQFQLLKALWTTLKSGGRLLYTTCSILPQENEKLIQKFIQETADAQLGTFNPEQLKMIDGIDTGFGYLHLPSENRDGFFYSLLIKK